MLSAAGLRRKRPFGAEVLDGGVHWRVHASKRRTVQVVLESEPAPRTIDLARELDGSFHGFDPRAGAGTLYRYALDGEPELRPDPASCWQPDGPHGPSMVVDSTQYAWSDARWKGIALRDAVFYELHIGTFTPEGTYAAAAEKFAGLRDLGITVIELMPLHEFPGRFGWGYDGVQLFAPYRGYGTPDDLRAFVDRAHGIGLGVVLDVVYNHFGPSGNYLREFSDDYFSTQIENEWGEALAFDGPGSAALRDLVVANARYWIDEFHCDGLRIDATQSIHDCSPTHIVTEIAAAVRTAAAGRTALVVAENEPQDTRLITPPERGGCGLDAMWSDDFHHAAVAALIGRREAYYSDFAGTPQELCSVVRWGLLYQGQRSRWQSKPRGTPGLDFAAPAFVTYLENHDQVANSARGERLATLAAPAAWRAMTAFWLLAPGTPLFFQGQEHGARAPFLYFADHEPELARLVAEGRTKFLAQFPSLASNPGRVPVADPSDIATFESSKLDWEIGPREQAIRDLVRALLALRREDPVLRHQDRERLFTAVLGTGAFLLRYRDDGAGDRLLIVNLGAERALEILPEPLLAPPRAAHWRLVFSSEDPAYGGNGTPVAETEVFDRLAGPCTVLLRAAGKEDDA